MVHVKYHTNKGKGDIFGCGYNKYGELGTGSLDGEKGILIPQKILNDPQVSNITLGQDFSFYITSK